MDKSFSGIITSEMISPGHPDKIADLIADEIAFAVTHDENNKIDRHSRCAIEVMLKDDVCIVAGEVKNAHIENFDNAILEGNRRSGYTSTAKENGWVDTLKVITLINSQSSEISNYVDGKIDEVAAGDQGIIFGYAVNETDELLPKAVKFNQLLLKNLSQYNVSLRPDMKCQTSMEYKDGRPMAIKTIVVAVSYNPSAVSHEDDVRELVSRVVRETLGSDYSPDIELQINPFTICGPSADTGLTGRKLISDTYQGYCPHGGGAISGKDLSKVDRSAAYYTRMIAKHIVAAGLADEAIIQMGFSIGHTQPVSICIDCRGREHYPTGKILAAVKRVFKLDTTSIFNTFINEDLGFGEYGWFADQNAPWERINPEVVDELRREIGK